MNTKELLILCVFVIVGVIIVAFAVVDSMSEGTHIELLSSSSLYDGENVIIQLTTENGTPIANQQIKLTFVGANDEKNSSNLVTDSEGQATFKVEGLAAGNYTLQCLFEGKGYKSSHFTSDLEIKEATTTVIGTGESDGSSNLPAAWQKGLEGPVIDVTYGDEYMTVYYKDNYYEKYDRNGLLVTFGHY